MMAPLIKSIILFFFFTPIFIYAQDGLSENKTEPISIGERTSIYSKILGQDRPILIYTPDGYNAGKETYPVIYLLDGGSNFHHTTASVGFLAKTGQIPKMIVVGIPNTDDRIRDLSPANTAQKEEYATSGGADSLINFMQAELFPFVEANYRTNNYKLLIGHSLGGLFATHALINHAGMFNSYLSISPSLWWDNQDLVLNQSEQFLTSQQELKGHFFMTMGNEGNTMVGGAWKLIALLEERGPGGLKWEFDRMEEETHGSIPFRSTYKGLQFIFAEWNIRKHEEKLRSGGALALEKYYADIDSYYGFRPMGIDRNIMNLGKELLEKGNATIALGLLEKCVEMNPENWEAKNALGSALMKSNKKEEAKEHLYAALKIKPDNKQAMVSLMKLGEDMSASLPDVKLTAAELVKHEGKYELNIGQTLTLTSDGKVLWVDGPGAPKTSLIPIGKNIFYVDMMSAELIFHYKGNKVSGFEVQLPDQKLTAKKL